MSPQVQGVDEVGVRDLMATTGQHRIVIAGGGTGRVGISVAARLRAVMAGNTPETKHHGHISCPTTTARNKMLLAEFDNELKPEPSFKLIDTPKEQCDMWLLRRRGLPFTYWDLMLRGRP